MPLVAQARDQVENLGDQHRRQPERRLVEHQELRARHQAARDGQHLVLPAGEIGDDLVQALEQHRETLAHLPHAPARYRLPSACDE